MTNCPSNVVNLLKPSIRKVSCYNFESVESASLSILADVTYSPDSPVNVPIESRNVRKIGTVSSNRIYKMHEITFIRVISTHCRI